jgi:hypothetical protein
MITNAFFGFAFALMAAQQAFETGRALVQKRVRRLTFRRTFATLDENPSVYWFDTVYHGFAVVALAAMSLLMFNSGAAQ